MNYLQMYINLSIILGILAFIFLIIFAATLDPSGGAEKGLKITLGVIATLLVLITIFCVAMAGLLS